MSGTLLKSTLHNVGVVIVGLGVAYLGTMVDSLFGISPFASPLGKAVALLLLGLGFLVRLWAVPNDRGPGTTFGLTVPATAGS